MSPCNGDKSPAYLPLTAVNGKSAQSLKGAADIIGSDRQHLLRRWRFHRQSKSICIQNTITLFGGYPHSLSRPQTYFAEISHALIKCGKGIVHHAAKISQNTVIHSFSSFPFCTVYSAVKEHMTKMQQTSLTKHLRLIAKVRRNYSFTVIPPLTDKKNPLREFLPEDFFINHRNYKNRLGSVSCFLGRPIRHFIASWGSAPL